MITIKRASCGIGSTLVAVALAGCGSNAADEFAAQSAEEIISATVADMDALESARVTAEIEAEDMPISLDLQLSTEGDCTGSVGIGDAVADVLAVDGTTWFKPDAAFFAQVIDDPAQVDAVVDAVDGKYIEDTQNQFGSFCDLDDLLENITDLEGDDKEVSKGDQTDVDGEDAIVIEGTTSDGDPSQILVATGEKHYILKFVAEGAEPGEATFSKFDEKVAVEAPAADDVFDLGSLG